MAEKTSNDWRATLNQRLTLSLWLAVVFGASVTTRLLDPKYRVADLGLEGSLIAGILGGYVTGLLSGFLISLPAVIAGEYLSMPLLAQQAPVSTTQGLGLQLVPLPL